MTSIAFSRRKKSESWKASSVKLREEDDLKDLRLGAFATQRICGITSRSRFSERSVARSSTRGGRRRSGIRFSATRLGPLHPGNVVTRLHSKADGSAGQPF